MQAKGEAALVTGGASGLGRATAAALTAAGARVALLDRNAELAEETAGEIGALAVPCDVTSEEAVAAAISTAREAHGIARICINCAGVGGSQRIVDRNGRRIPFENYKRIVDICLFGSFNMLSQAAEDMAKLEPADGEGLRGVVVNTASVAGYEGQIGQIAYASAKAGIVGMTLPAARDLAGWGVRVCTIAPGIMDTPLLAGLPDATLDLLGKQVPFPKRTGRDREFASLVMEIVRNDYMNGETIRLDGAIRLAPR